MLWNVCAEGVTSLVSMVTSALPSAAVPPWLEVWVRHLPGLELEPGPTNISSDETMTMSPVVYIYGHSSNE